MKKKVKQFLVVIIIIVGLFSFYSWGEMVLHENLHIKNCELHGGEVVEKDYFPTPFIRCNQTTLEQGRIDILIESEDVHSSNIELYVGLIAFVMLTVFLLEYKIE